MGMTMATGTTMAMGMTMATTTTMATGRTTTMAGMDMGTGTTTTAATATATAMGTGMADIMAVDMAAAAFPALPAAP
ncbi:hypothetical protein E2979_06700 [Paracoccus yeei]